MERVERWLPLTGIAYVVLGIAGVVVAGDSPDFLPDGDEVVQYLTEDSGRAIGAGVLWLLSMVPLLWFLGVLRSRLRVSEGGDDRLTWTAVGAGIAGTALVAASTSIQISGALRADDDGGIAPDSAALVWDLGNILYGVAAPVFFGVTVLAVGILSLWRGGPFPAWLSWAGIVSAVIAFIPPISWVFIFFLFNLWVLVAAILLLRRPAGLPEGVSAVQYTEVTQVTVALDEEE
jgi:hypothetical protein